MPILAALAVNETSLNTGAAAGNEPPPATVLGMPLTEIVARMTFAATGFVPVNKLDGPMLDFGFWGEAGSEEVDFVIEAQPAAPQSEICW